MAQPNSDDLTVTLFVQGNQPALVVIPVDIYEEGMALKLRKPRTKRICPLRQMWRTALCRFGIHTEA